MPVMAASQPTPYPVAARELLRTTLLDAASRLLNERSWPEVTMGDIAEAAGVSRQTLYREFGSRAEFAQAYVLREGDRFITGVAAAINAHLDDPGAALQSAFDVFLEAAADDPLIRAVISGGSGTEELLPLVTTQGRPLLERATERLAEVILGGWPQVTEADATLLAECLVRLAISHATLPSGPARLDGRAVRKLLEPYLEQVLATAQQRS